MGLRERAYIVSSGARVWWIEQALWCSKGLLLEHSALQTVETVLPVLLYPMDRIDEYPDDYSWIFVCLVRLVEYVVMHS